MNERARSFHRHHPNHWPIRGSDIRRAYKEGNVTQQKMRWYPGPTNKTFDEQNDHLTLVKTQLQQLFDEGYEIFQIDEAVFSPKRYDDREWAPMCLPLAKYNRFQSTKYTACIAAISLERGLVHFATSAGKAFDKPMFQHFLAELRVKAGRDKKLAVFVDGASIHTSSRVDVRNRLDIKMPLIVNAAYRPDLNGIELSWGVAKKYYRQFCSALKPFQGVWDNEIKVQECMSILTKAQTQQHARLGWERLFDAEPIMQRHLHQRVPELFYMHQLQTNDVVPGSNYYTR
jgi:hypothetical protein